MWRDLVTCVHDCNSFCHYLFITTWESAYIDWMVDWESTTLPTPVDQTLRPLFVNMTLRYLNSSTWISNSFQALLKWNKLWWLSSFLCSIEVGWLALRFVYYCQTSVQKLNFGISESIQTSTRKELRFLLDWFFHLLLQYSYKWSAVNTQQKWKLEKST